MAECEILFRGQTRRKNEWAKMPSSNWVYGGIFVPEDNLNFAIIIAQQENAVEKHSVYGDTVGQYTGLTDKNGTKIFEGDIIIYGFKPCVVKWDNINACFSLYENVKTQISGFNADTMKLLEIIGNIYDNPELLKEAEQK